MSVRLVPWGDGDFPLLVRLLGDPAMTEHLGGPEDDAALRTRQRRYVEAEDGVFNSVDAAGADVGWVGYWDARGRRPSARTRPAGRSCPSTKAAGSPVRATAVAIERMRAVPGHPRYLYAWPNVENGPSNGICRKLGF